MKRKAIEYLFSSAQKDVDLHKLKTQIDDTKLKMKCSIKNRKEKRSLMSSDFFKTNYNVSKKKNLIHFNFIYFFRVHLAAKVQIRIQIKILILRKFMLSLKNKNFWRRLITLISIILMTTWLRMKNLMKTLLS